jgi:putative PIN family toxin of toxin-antitoxin system
VLLAAFGTRGLCADVFSVCLSSHEIILSEAILAETQRHLARKFKMPGPRAREIVEFLRGHSRLVDPVPIPSDACRDPNDLAILGTALAGQCDCVVTGDDDLLTLGSFRGIAVLSPRALYERLRKSPD